jgi:hypothetical protein
MSKGLGRLQRWLLANLPVRESDHRATAAELAVAYYGTDTPTVSQRTTVLRSLDSLSQRGLITRWPPQSHRRGKPISWSR